MYESFPLHLCKSFVFPFLPLVPAPSNGRRSTSQSRGALHRGRGLEGASFIFAFFYSACVRVGRGGPGRDTDKGQGVEEYHSC